MSDLLRKEQRVTNLMIALPSGDQIEAATVQCLSAMIGYTAVNGEGLKFGMLNRQASSVAGNRNAIVEQALSAGADWILWIDSDMTFPANVIPRLLAHKRPIVGATYNKRVHPYETLGRLLGDPNNPPMHGLVPALLMPGGMMLVHTDVYRTIGFPWYFENYFSPATDPVAAFINRLRDQSYIAVTPEVEATVATTLGGWIKAEYDERKNVCGDHTAMGEDYSFCRKARQHGYGIFCDLDLTHEMGHIGKQVISTLPAGGGHFYQNIQGWFDGAACRLYSRMVAEAHNGSHFVEVGAWKGRSSAYMAVEIAQSGKNIQFDVVDHFKGSDEDVHKNDPAIISGTLRKVFEDNTRAVRNFINIVEMDSREAAENYNDASLDFVYIDAGHDYDSVHADISAWLRKIRPGGTLAGDDFNWPGVQQAVRELFTRDSVVVDNTQWWFKVPEASRVAA